MKKQSKTDLARKIDKDMPLVTEALGVYIRMWRMNDGISVVEFCKMNSISRASLYNIEYGFVCPSVALTMKLFDFIGVDFSCFFHFLEIYRVDKSARKTLKYKSMKKKSARSKKEGKASAI